MNMPIGETATGKLILATYDEAHVSGWTLLDHAQAACAHGVMSEQILAAAKGLIDSEVQRLREMALHHAKQADLHGAAAECLEAAQQTVWH